MTSTRMAALASLVLLQFLVHMVVGQSPPSMCSLLALTASALPTAGMGC